jgi:hypothetical protein
VAYPPGGIDQDATTVGVMTAFACSIAVRTLLGYN